MCAKLRGLLGLASVGVLSLLAGCSTCSTCGKGSNQANQIRSAAAANGPMMTSGMTPRTGNNPVMATSQSNQQGYTRTTLPSNGGTANYSTSSGTPNSQPSAPVNQVQPAGMSVPQTVDLPPVSPATPPAGSMDMSLVPPAPPSAPPSAPNAVPTLPGQN